MNLKPYPKYKDSEIEWLGEVPEGWEVKRLKWIASLEYGNSLSEDDREEGDVPVYGSNGIVGKHSKNITGSPAIIIGRKGSYGKVSYSEAPCFPIDTTYYIDPSLTKENIRWLYYLLSSINLDEITFDTGVPGLSREFAYSKIIPLPTPKEQTVIATFLDHKTTKIDELIKENEKLIELLKEKRQAIISHAVTKGLDPNAKMKDSGIEWIGEIPEGWEVIKTHYLLNVLSGNGFPENLQGMTEGEYPFFKVSDINVNATFISEANNYVTKEVVLKNKWKIIPSNSILLPKIGEALKKNHRIINKQDCLIDNNMMALYPKKMRYINKIFLYFLLCYIDMEWFANPGAVPSVDVKKFKLSFLPIPSKDKQTAIANFLDQKTTKIDKTIQKIESQIATLKEYRQALISNVVTGKVRVAGQL